MSLQVTPGIVKQDLLALSHGLATSPPGEQATLVVDGVSARISDLVTEIDGYVAAYMAVDAAKARYKMALAARIAIEPQAIARRCEIRAAVKGMMGRDNPALSKFGMSPDKPRHPLGVVDVTEKVALTKATRAARHTMGKKQKLAIKGKVPPHGPPPSPSANDASQPG